jgi:hypothetical protein
MDISQTQQYADATQFVRCNSESVIARQIANMLVSFEKVTTELNIVKLELHTTAEELRSAITFVKELQPKAKPLTIKDIIEEYSK